jgi:smad nuclear-interacting protein 1
MPRDAPPHLSDRDIDRGSDRTRDRSRSPRRERNRSRDREVKREREGSPRRDWAERGGRRDDDRGERSERGGRSDRDRDERGAGNGERAWGPGSGKNLGPEPPYGAKEREAERSADRKRYDESGEVAVVKSPPKPNFSNSGMLAKESNTVKGVELKYHEPPEARKPTKNWRLYVFKGEEQVGE